MTVPIDAALDVTDREAVFALVENTAKESGRLDYMFNNVNTASMVGLIYQPITVAYVMTKQAVVGLSLSLRIEAAGLGVRVSAVCPGVVKTPLYDHSPSERASIPDVMGILPVRACTAEKAAEHI